jgi:hypothetical protein
MITLTGLFDTSISRRLECPRFRRTAYPLHNFWSLKTGMYVMSLEDTAFEILNHLKENKNNNISISTND